MLDRAARKRFLKHKQKHGVRKKMLGAREINDIRNISFDEMDGEENKDCLRPHHEAY